MISGFVAMICHTSDEDEARRQRERRIKLLLSTTRWPSEYISCSLRRLLLLLLSIPVSFHYAHGPDSGDLPLFRW